MRRALIVGIDDYQQAPLSGCVNDANAILLIHESPLTDALFLLVSKSDEVTTT